MTAPIEQRRAAAPARDDERARLRDEVIAGLQASRKTLPPKLFYDQTGARLFELITRQPEYYLTRAELSILRRQAGDIAELAGPGCALIEYGSGAGVKVRLLLDALARPLAYVPIDISREQLARVAAEIARAYPGLEVHPLAADYTSRIDLPPLPPAARRLAFFPGSTIGNFHPAEAAAFLTRIRRTIGAGGLLILGVDRVKDARTIEAAYNDAAGVTAAFNRNLLVRINRELEATFDLDRFAHRALFSVEASRIEMHLVSTVAQTVRVDGVAIHFDAGETIWTESSYKYDDDRLAELAGAAGFRVRRLWTDERGLFRVAALEA